MGMSNDAEIREEIIEHMARAFFACAWADWNDEYSEGCQGNGVDVMDEMPNEIDPAAIAAANDLAEALEKSHRAPLPQIFRRAVMLSGDDGDRDKTPEMFGHYAAMGAMGHGVNLHDSLGSKAAVWVDVPYMEFSPFDLDSTKYPIPYEEVERTPEQKARDAEVLAILDAPERNAAGFYSDCPECHGTGKHTGFLLTTDCKSCPKR